MSYSLEVAVCRRGVIQKIQQTEVSTRPNQRDKFYRAGHVRSKSEYRYTNFDSLQCCRQAALLLKPIQKFTRNLTFAIYTREAFCSQNSMLKKLSEMINCQGVEPYLVYTQHRQWVCGYFLLEKLNITKVFTFVTFMVVPHNTLDLCSFSSLLDLYCSSAFYKWEFYSSPAKWEF